MTQLIPLQKEHIERLVEIVKDAEPHLSYATNNTAFERIMLNRHAWTAVKDGDIIGCISISDINVKIDCIMHGFFHPSVHGEWWDSRVSDVMFDYVFNIIECRRFSTYDIIGITNLESFLIRLGFKKEGTKRKAVLLDDGYHDIDLYGMLKEECIWI